MKKYVVFILVSMLLVNLLPVNVVNAEDDYVTVHMNGEDKRVKVVNVLFNGQALESDIPSFILDERTLVPIRFITEHLKADIKWVQETKEVIINSGGKEIILQIDSSKVLINGEEKDLPYNVPAKLVNHGRTFVPLRFVSEELGCDVEWDHSTYTAVINFKQNEVTDISVNQDLEVPKVRIDTTGVVNYNIIKLQDNTKIVLDIDNTLLKLNDISKYNGSGVVEIDVNKYPIKNVKSSQFQYDPDITRVVVNLEEYVDYEIRNLKDSNGLEISFLNKLSDINTNENNEEEVVIENTKEPKYNLFSLSDPKRLVVDLFDTIYQNDIQQFEIENGVIKGVRTSQFNPEGTYTNTEDVLRVVFDIKDDVRTYNLKTRTEGNNLILNLQKGLIDGINYVVNSESKEAFLNIKNVEEDDYELTYDGEKSLMTIKLDKDKVNIDNGLIIDNNYHVRDIEVSEDRDNKIIKVKFNNLISYEAIISSLGLTIKMNIGEKVESPFSDKLIVIDAGHGGTDPGTIGPITKVKEKNLNLKVAFKLKEELENLGFKTFLTRDNDEYVGLYDRTDMANALEADAFVSIHFNANGKPEIEGIQALYCPAYDSDVKTEDQYPFAETIHNEVLSALGRKDMKIIKRPDLVVTRESQMVSVLMELGFVTNPEEEALLITDEYQNKAAKGIANGLVKYFENK